MLISTVLTSGQVTFILRVVVQILSSGGLFLIGLIILGNAPRVASIATHDVLNRVAGKQTTTSVCLKWLLKRGKANDPTNTSRLAMGVALLISYTLVTKLTDVGLIGLRACQTAGASYTDNPASIRTDEQALNMVTTNMINGSDPAKVKYFRCDSSEFFRLDGDNSTMYGCTSWKNATYADKKAFEGLNLSDTAVLMPRQLARYNYSRADIFELNGYFMGPLSRRIEEPTIMNGILVYPHETGFRAFLGAPNLPPFTRTTIPQTLALEVDIGCMTVGMYLQKTMTAVFSTGSRDFFETTNGTWRRYFGPDYLKDVISQTVDEVRNYSMPLWNMSTIDQRGIVRSWNESIGVPLSTAPNVQNVFLPDLPANFSADNIDDHRYVFGNCTARLENQLNITGGLGEEQYGNACNMLGLGGSIREDGDLFAAMSRMVCATATHVNLVRADISADGNGKIDMSFERLPSDLNTVYAGYWDIMERENQTEFHSWDSIYRYTLTPNPNGQTIHYVNAREFDSSRYAWGAGAGANCFPSVPGVMLMTAGLMRDQFASLSYLGDGNTVIKFEPSHVTKWAGQLGASYILGSTALNGWAAASLQSGPLTVFSTGGKPATCYNPLYALAFVPLVLAVVVIIVLALEMLFSSTLLKARKMEKFYGGFEPYANAVCPDRPPSDTLLVWENYGQPRLEPVQNGQTIQVGGNGTAVEHLHTDVLYRDGKE